MLERFEDDMHVVNVSIMLLSVDYLYSISCKHLLPLCGVFLQVVRMSFFLYPMALYMPGLWCCGLLYFGSRLMGILVGSCGVDLSSCSPSWPASKACR